MVVGIKPGFQPGRLGQAPPHAAARRHAAAADPRRGAAHTCVEVDTFSGQSREFNLGGGGPSSPAAAAEEAPAPAAALDPLALLRSFFLPAGYPATVTPDYLPYQLWTAPTHVTGWISHSLATSSMLTAVGFGGAGAAATVGASAAIKWITKDGLGAAGRLLVGGRLSRVFDEDPKRWRMVSEFITTGGLALEIATQLHPSSFVLLAGSGTLAKATAKGMGRPAYRVVQTHFGTANNVGSVAAKEEVWEVTAELAGLAGSVAVLRGLEAVGPPEAIIPVWAAIHAAHILLRYRALSTLRFAFPNQKRAAALARAHVAGRGVPSVEEANAAEPILALPTACAPRAFFGCSVAEALGGDAAAVAGGGGGSTAEQLGRLLRVYAGERYVLTWRDGAARVLLDDDSRPRDLVTAMWQAAWLDSRRGGGAGGASGGEAAGLALLEESLEATRRAAPDFEACCAAAGWQLDRAVFPSGTWRLRRGGGGGGSNGGNGDGGGGLDEAQQQLLPLGGGSDLDLGSMSDGV